MRIEVSEVIAMTREAIEVPSDDAYRKYEPGPVTLWVNGRPVGYINAAQQATVADLLRSGVIPTDLDLWVRSLGLAEKPTTPGPIPQGDQAGRASAPGEGRDL